MKSQQQWINCYRKYNSIVRAQRTMAEYSERETKLFFKKKIA